MTEEFKPGARVIIGSGDGDPSIPPSKGFFTRVMTTRCEGHDHFLHEVAIRHQGQFVRFGCCPLTIKRDTDGAA